MANNPFEKLKQVKPNEVPKQKVVPVKMKKRDREQSYTLWLDKELLKQLTRMAVEQNTNVKSLVEEAVRAFLQ